MFAAEIAKVRYLPLPRWVALFVLAAAVITGAALIVVTPKSAGSYVDIPTLVVDQVLTIAAAVFGVWVAALEFSSGTLQRTLSAEPDRNRVLLAKLGLVLGAAAFVGAAAAATAGGLSNIAIVRADSSADVGDLARSVFAIIPDGILAAAIGFGFGLLARSLGGGITLALAFLYVLSGVLAFIPGLKNVAYIQASSDLTAALSGTGETGHSGPVALLILICWLAVIVVPGWVLFVRADLK
jgi:ABC-2 type transport system permease protein